MPEQDAQQAIQQFMLGYLEQQKAATVNRYRMLNEHAVHGQVVFAGSSLMEYFPIAEMELTDPGDLLSYNRGVAGSTTDDLLRWLDVCILDLRPSKLFINIGTNDIGSPGYVEDALIANYESILGRIRHALPACAIHVMAYYPVNAKHDFGLDPAMQQMMFATRTNDAITSANRALEGLAARQGARFIDVNDGLRDEEGNLRAEFSVEGLHLWPNAYVVIRENLRPYLR